jgi:hypothetical protein
MANSIEKAKKYTSIISEVYKQQSLTELLDAETQPDLSGGNEVKVLQVATTGLGAYSRSDGYPKGDVTATWETLALTQERGKELSIDRMDDDETLGMVFGAVTGNFMREWVAPELDAYRFAKYAASSGVSTEEDTLTKANILAAIDEAKQRLDNDEVPDQGRILFVSADLQLPLAGAVTRTFGSESEINAVVSAYNGMKLVYVPRSRFYTEITLNGGGASWGYAKGEDAQDINFMLLYPGAVLQATKFSMPKIFSPDENQDKDMWKFQFRLYHDAFVYPSKAKGVYAHCRPVS